MDEIEKNKTQRSLGNAKETKINSLFRVFVSRGPELQPERRNLKNPSASFFLFCVEIEKSSITFVRIN